jgi:DNA integrity scanning protein DisA with diadenylate cyclase activity
VQGNGKVYFIEGRSDSNKIILQILDSKVVIKDNEFIISFIKKKLGEFTSVQVQDQQIETFSKWVFSLSLKKHGTSLIFLGLDQSIEEKLVKTTRVDINSAELFGGEVDPGDNNHRHDLSLLNSIINPDGAVIFNQNLIPTNISTILPMGDSAGSTGGGARHNSVSNYTEAFQCLGIVISEDGPISIFKNGRKLIQF